jgi:hypothetical protein
MSGRIMSLLSIDVERNKPKTKPGSEKLYGKQDYYAITIITGLSLGIVLVSMLVLPLIIPTSNGQVRGELNS